MTSKAEQWAASNKLAPKDLILPGEHLPTAKVTNDGKMFIHGCDDFFSQANALRLRDWITENFEDIFKDG